MRRPKGEEESVPVEGLDVVPTRYHPVMDARDICHDGAVIRFLAVATGLSYQAVMPEKVTTASGWTGAAS